MSLADSSQAAACGSDSSHLLAGTSCSDTGVPTGSYQYVVTAVFATWTAVSSPSANVSVVDVPPPYVESITLADPSPTTAPGSLDWTVTFSANVTGVDVADFSVASSGLSGAPAVTGVTGSSDTYNVTASSGSGSGTLGLNLVDNNSIVDSYSQPLVNSLGGPNGSFTGQAYTVDRAAPTNSLSLVAQTGGASYLAGSTVFYRGTGSGSGGSFAIRNTASDTGGSGPRVEHDRGARRHGDRLDAHAGHRLHACRRPVRLEHVHLVGRHGEPADRDRDLGRRRGQHDA